MTMHTDEYEISLSREIDVCKGRIKAIKKDILKIEKKYGFDTGSFQNNKSDSDNVSESDANNWTECIELLNTWELKQREFEALFNRMKK